METLRNKLSRLSVRKTLALVIVVSVLLRIAAALYFGDQVVELPGTNDQLSYHHLALRLLGGHGFSFGEDWWPATRAGAPTAHWSFLYTYFLAAVYALVGPHPLAARLLQAILVGMLHPLLIYLIGKRVFNSTIGLIAAGLSAVYAYFVYYAAVLMTEPFYITAILAALYFSLMYVDQGKSPGNTRRKDWLTGALLGIALAAAVLLRQLFLLFIPFLLIWVWWARRRQTTRAPLAPLLLSCCIIVAAILPFTLYNYMRFDRFVLLNTNAGYAFFFGNHPVYGTHFVPILSPESGGYLALLPKELLTLDEAALDQELLRRGLGFVIADPVRYLRLSLSRIPAYFMFWPSRESGLISNLARVLSFGLLWPFMLYGLARSLIFRPWSFSRLFFSNIFLLQLFVVVYTMIHLLSWALVRYRLPVDAVLILFAGTAFVDLYRRLLGVRRLRSSKNTGKTVSQA